MRRRFRVLLPLIASAAVAAPLASVVAQDAPVMNPAPTAKDWAGIGKLPDWSGIWIPDTKDQVAQMTSNPTPWTPKAAAQINHQFDEEKAGRPLGVFTNCMPEAMPSWMLISHNAMEIAVTPGKIYMLGESDSNRLRRIYTDGRPHPEDPDLTFHGHSIGHWDGDTLVVDTIAVVPEAWIAISEAQGVPNNGDMHIVERIHLTGPDTLADELTITAPKVFTKPWSTTRLFDRSRNRAYDIVEGVCLEGSFDHQTDKNGNAVFVAQPRTEDGNRTPAK